MAASSAEAEPSGPPSGHSPAISVAQGPVPLAPGQRAVFSLDRFLPLPRTESDDFTMVEEDGRRFIRLTFPHSHSSTRGGLRYYTSAYPNMTYEVRVRARATSSNVRLAVAYTHRALNYRDRDAHTGLEPDSLPELKSEWKEYVFRGTTARNERIQNDISILKITVEHVGGADPYQVDVDRVIVQALPPAPESEGPA
jgi:hypothetical protein